VSGRVPLCEREREGAVRGRVYLSGWVDEREGVSSWALLSVDSFKRGLGVSRRHILSGGVCERDGVPSWVLLSEQYDGRADRVSRGVLLRGWVY
jgi:hypothetical protein